MIFLLTTLTVQRFLKKAEKRTNCQAWHYFPLESFLFPENGIFRSIFQSGNTALHFFRRTDRIDNFFAHSFEVRHRDQMITFSTHFIKQVNRSESNTDTHLGISVAISSGRNRAYIKNYLLQELTSRTSLLIINNMSFLWRILKNK